MMMILNFLQKTPKGIHIKTNDGLTGLIYNIQFSHIITV